MNDQLIIEFRNYCIYLLELLKDIYSVAFMNEINALLETYFPQIEVSKDLLTIYMHDGNDTCESFRGIVRGPTDIKIFDQNGIEYRDKVEELIKESFREEIFSNNVPLYVLKTFIEDYLDCAGFGLDGNASDCEDMDLSKDPFWKYIKDLYKVKEDRLLQIHTFGNKYKKFASWKNDTDKSFGAFVESKKPKNLRNMRGTDEGIQKTVRSGKKFELIMANIVREVEGQNMKTIGIFCRAGHHRSVACGELLKKYVYTKAKITHKTINT